MFEEERQIVEKPVEEPVTEEPIETAYHEEEELGP